MKVETIDAERITVAAEFLELLRQNGLDAFEKVMAVQGGRPARDFPGRRTVRLELKTSQGRTQGVFLKRYESNYLGRGRRWLRRFRWPGADDEARREWDMILRVRSLGIPTAIPIAIGQQREGGAVVRSFLLTAEIEGAVEGQAYAAQGPAAERRRFLLEVAELVRRFHQAGLVHKDLYIGHILVVPGRSTAELFLIDMQRVIAPCCFRNRWLVKDLGALAYSALKAGARRGELLSAFKAYCNATRLRSEDKKLARQTLRRVAWLCTRRPKHDPNFEQLTFGVGRRKGSEGPVR